MVWKVFKKKGLQYTLVHFTIFQASGDLEVKNKELSGKDQ